ncbi:hypothetical protein BDV95DRAFT_612703 [Massariosphaeria phaeospora]|uniref:MYND-type domain-containing protein n=1 Tax=Massariosphaeria phaeospora TaxID=100035 RepID=A0A7C8I636_9PLEO|nr:hypothetical protein BDV95DRAFT_612703 [Massariosphaeria phaeospora]
MSTPKPCFRCQRYPDEDENPFLHCGRCKGRTYCSTHCQHNDWTAHKVECRIVASGGALQDRNRSTFRLNLAGLLQEPGTTATPDPDMIYYLKTSKESIKDISISGPF